MYTATHGADPYRTDAVTTASPAELVLMLYDRVLTAIVRSRHAMAQQPVQLQVMHDEVTRAQDIVTELQVTLDHERGGEVAGNLHALYAYCLEQLLAANMRKDLQPLEVVESTVRGLRDAWEQACVRGAVAAGVA